MGVNHTAYVAVEALALLVQLLKIGEDVGQETMALDHIVAIGHVASDIVGSQYTRVGDTPLVAGETESALLKLRALIDVAETGDLGPAGAIDDRGWRLTINIGEDTVDGLLHLFDLRDAIGYAIARPHEVQGRVVVIDGLLGCQQRG